MTESIQISGLTENLHKRVKELRRAAPLVKASRAIVDKALQGGRAYYGINTGFGGLANKRIADDKLRELQTNLVMSHAVGLGQNIPRDISRLMLLLKIQNLSLGYSGISLETFNRLLDFAEKDLIPAAPCKGSLGASGDLAPLAHLSLPLIGKGFFWNEAGTAVAPAEKILKENKLAPIVLGAKDGLALLNGTQMMSAYGCYVLERAQNLLKTADILAAMSLEALRGSLQPFDARVHAVRPHPGQIAVAENVRLIMTDSEILESHRDCDKVQDPYSLRCVPQVHGACRDALAYAQRVFEIEINSVTDNPLVFENGDIVSGGNFHGEPLAMAMDFAAIALAEIASISERRIYLLLEGHDGLPKLLLNDTGINSGFMLPQYTAAALVSQNKIFCHPASVDSIPTSLGQEDHVSMGSLAALKLLEVFENVEQVLGIEAFTAAQALDFRKPLKAGRGVELAHQKIRAAVPHRDRDHLFQDDIAACIDLLRSSRMVAAVEKSLGKLH